MSRKHGADVVTRERASIPSPLRRVVLAICGRDTVKVETKREAVNSRAFAKRYKAERRRNKAARHARRANRA